MNDSLDRVAAIRQMWTVGSYEVIGAMFAPISQQVVDDLDLAGKRVLDAATGTGNTAIAAARAGAEVSAFDLTPRLLDVARRQTTAAGVDVDFREGDLVDIPFADDSFDVVVSTFGAFTVDDQQACARELVRVCRPGGMVVTTAWSDEGYFAELRRTAMPHHPAPPDPDAPAPVWWAQRDGLDRIFAGLPVDIDLERRTAWFAFPTPQFALYVLEMASGPIQSLVAEFEEHAAGTWQQVRAETLDRWDALVRPAGHGVELPAVYGLARTTVRADGASA